MKITEAKRMETTVTTKLMAELKMMSLKKRLEGQIEISIFSRHKRADFSKNGQSRFLFRLFLSFPHDTII